MRFDLTVNHFTRDLSLGRPLEVFGAKLWRPYAHIGDLAEAVRCVINEGPAATDRKIYNTGAPTENYSKESIVNEVLKLVPDAQVHYAGNATNDLRNYRVDFSRIHAELGFEPKWNVAAGVKEVHKLVTSGFLSDPFNPIYKNA
jgi:nucleoside-diphosphate-sugar epimerase